MLEYWPAVAVPVAVYCHVSPGSSRPSWLASPALYGWPLKSLSTGCGFTPAMLSVTATFLMGSLPVLATLYVHVTVDPTGTMGPTGTPGVGLASLLVPLVN